MLTCPRSMDCSRFLRFRRLANGELPRILNGMSIGTFKEPDRMVRVRETRLGDGARSFRSGAPGNPRVKGTKTARAHRLVLSILVLAVSQVLRYLVDRRLACKFVRPAIFHIVDVQSFRDPLQYAQRPGRFPFGKEIDLQFEVVAPL